MTVTDLQPLDKKRTKVFLDGEEAFVLYHKELRDHGIEAGTELSEAVYEEIMTVVLIKRARLRAMHLLQVRPYTEHKLREKLTDGHYPEDVIEDALTYVKSYGYVDDHRYALDYATYHMADRPRRRICTDLMKKGIAPDVIEQAVEEAYTDLPLEGKVAPKGTDEVDPEYTLLRKELKKRRFDPETATYEEIQKLKAALYRKGFSPDLIHKIDNTSQKS